MDSNTYIIILLVIIAVICMCVVSFRKPKTTELKNKLTQLRVSNRKLQSELVDLIIERVNSIQK